MREILFRGKLKTDNGEYKKGDWVYGDFVTLIDGKEKHLHIYGKGEVKAETIGQYTGLTANGTKIFEGDIVEGHCHSQWRHRLQRCVVAYERDGFEARHYLNYPNKEHYFKYKVLFSKDVVVIGNIHDNPELLGVMCETCQYYDTDRQDQPCCGCVDGCNYEESEVQGE